tara:strand:- start:874 stop:1929 length:1056 start_codon:yes stop_codon:yes gene_type:complete
MAKSDYYKVLGLDDTASADEIKRAYRKLAQKYHPDKNPDDTESEEKFKECSEAYSVLSDPKRKHEYDRFGHTDPSAGRQRSHQTHGFSGFEDVFGGFGDVFGDIFGGTKRSTRGSRPADLLGSIQLSFDNAAFGCSQPVTFKRRGPCNVCEGSGADQGSKPSVCKTCGGGGNVRHQQGSFIVQMTCKTCHGNGRIIENPCRNCGGNGTVVEECTINVNIPAGVEPGSKMRIQGAGESGPDGRRGDVYVEISVEAHPYFRRDGANIYSDANIKFSEAALGSKIEIETLHGNETIVLPPGTQIGATLRLTGKGAPRVRSTSRGDHFVTIKVEVPDSLNDKQRDALKEISDLGL